MCERVNRQVREALAKNDRARINVFVEQLTSLLNSNLPSSSSSSSNSPQSVNARNGALIGLAGVAIALGIEIAPYLQTIVPPILVCFADPDSKIRYVHPLRLSQMACPWLTKAHCPQLLCLRELLQHRKGLQGRDPHVL